MAFIHALLVVLLAGPVVLILWGILKGRNQEQAPPGKHVPTFLILLNSSVLYALTYNMVYFVQELFLALGKQAIGLTAYLYHNNHNWEGSDPREDLMQGLGGATIFVAGLILLFVYQRARNKKSWGSLFILWLSFHSLIQSLPQFFTAPLDPGSDMGAALAYLNLPDAGNIAIATAAFVSIVAVSYLYSRYFLGLGHPSHTSDHPYRRLRTVWQTAVLPAIIGTILLFPYRIPPVDRYTMTYMLLLISIPSIAAFSWMGKAPQRNGNVAWGRVLILPLILSVIVLLVFHLVLRPGVVFPGI